MELDWLEDFLTLSASGSFSRAAEQRHVTQPAFSRRIRALEDWVGAPLIDRSAHPASLTEAGRRFRPAAEEILRRLAAARQEARTAEEAAAATLRFAATYALSLSFFPAWLRELEPGLRLGPIQLVSDSLQACEELMLQGRAQFLLCHHHPSVASRLDTAEFLSTRVGADTLVPVAVADAAGKPRFAIPGARGSSLPVLAYNEESGLGRILRTVGGKAPDGARLEPVFRSHLAVVLKRMAMDGRGVAWLPLSLIGDELGDGRLVRAGGNGWLVPVEIRLVRRGATAPPAAEAFWRIACGAARIAP
ncbi:MAG TPA: LysR family transcriptional regulator [Acetobacteraceae bacterium]|nr:LysR family transcriptional regulator [Acetobacteraceae bacterium]